MNYLIVSYFTKKTGYEQEIKNLEASLKLHELDYHIEGIDDLGSWQQNTHYKAPFILNMLYRFPEKNIVFLDADALVREKPVLFETIEADVAAHMREGFELLSGTLFFRNCLPAREVVIMWILENERRPASWDQQNLQRAIQGHGPSFLNLPAGYCQIFDLMGHHGSPVIEHFQASRRYKMR